MRAGFIWGIMVHRMYTELEQFFMAGVITDCIEISFRIPKEE